VNLESIMEADIRYRSLRAVVIAAVLLATPALPTSRLNAQESTPPVQAVPTDTVPQPPPPADTIPAAPAATAARPSNPWKIAAEMSFTDQSGNRVLRLLTGGVKVAHRDPDRYELDGRFESRYGKSEGEVVARNQYASLALDLQPNSTWSPFLFSNAERDEFKRLDLRFSGGAGARYTLWDDAAVQNTASVSLALLYSFEDLIATEAQPLAPSRSLARWSLRVKGSQSLREGFTVHHTSFYQPVWDEMADYLLRSDTGAKVLLTRRLALSVGYQLSRNNRPPDGVEPDDRLLKTGFIIDF
jgi:putative salt-induced outer membrane protein YdiY